MPEKIIRIMNRNRITMPAEAFNDVGISVRDYVIARWYPRERKIYIMPAEIVSK